MNILAGRTAHHFAGGIPPPASLALRCTARVVGSPQNNLGLVRQQPAPAISSRFTFRERTIDFEQLEVHMGDKTMPLTLMEASLLRYLVEHEGRPVSRKTILEKVWGVREDTDTRAIDNFIVRLRRYLEDEPANPRHLQTVRGVGYRFVANPE